MTHPVVTRLGIKQFWYNHWYSDTMQASNLKQDKSLRQLLEFYLNYGLTTKSGLFIHEYWYNKKYTRLRLAESTNYTRSFRRFYFTNETLSIEHSYLVRNRTGEYFPLKVWLFRYQGWFIISVKWFKPRKSKFRNAAGNAPSHLSVAARTTKVPAAARRLKLLSLLLLNTTRGRDTHSYMF